MTDLFDELLDAAEKGVSPTPAALNKLQKIHGAESRAADEVAPRVMRNRFRYAPGLGWLEWDGRRWCDGPTSEERVKQATREFIDHVERDLRANIVELEKEVAELEAEILTSATPEDITKAEEEAKFKAKLIAQHADQGQHQRWKKLNRKLFEARAQCEMWLNLLNESKISNIAKLCRRIDGVLTDAADFDQHHDLLNCTNGVVDLRTGNIKAHDPELLITQIAGGAYDPESRCPRWDQALQALHSDALEWFQIRVGQAFTGYTPDDDSLVLSTGGGENGKSTIMAGVTRAAGTYFTLVSDRVLLAQPGQHPTEMMDFRGSRVALMEETPEEGHLDTHQLKAIVGTPKMKARRMRQDPVEWEPTHSLFINTNHLPQVDTTDHGTWRRLKRMPWPYKFVKTPSEDGERKGDKTLRPYIQHGGGVAEAVLTWVVQGAVKWYAQRDNPQDDPQTVAQAGKEWRAQSDVGFQFASEHLIADRDAFILSTVLSNEFNDFLREQNKREWSVPRINQRMPDSMQEAGIIALQTPAKLYKVRKTDSESRPGGRTSGGSVAWATSSRPQPGSPAAGKPVRAWVGVRFRTAAEQAEATGGPELKVVSHPTDSWKAASGSNWVQLDENGEDQPF